MTRRTLLAALSSAAATCLFAAPSPPVLGARLDGLRILLQTDPDRVLKAIAGIGFRDVEGFARPQAVTLAPRLKNYDLVLRSCPLETPLVTGNWDPYPELKQVSLIEAIDSLRVLGVEFATMGYIPLGARGDGDDFYRRTADRMNVVAEACRKARIRFAWQNHAFEFDGRPGARAIDIYKTRTDPKLVNFELDTFWAGVAGQDPLELLRVWKGRVPLLHLSGKAKDAPRSFTENVGQGSFASLRDSALDVAALYNAALLEGTRYCFLGVEQTAEDPLELLRSDYKSLKDLMSSGK